MEAVLKELKKRGHKRVMIEGGAAIISTCLTSVRRDGAPLVDAVVVTVAPTLVGSDGIAASDASKVRPPFAPLALATLTLACQLGNSLPRLLPVATATFGTDAVFLTKLR